MATIIIRNSTGSGAVPSSLVQGELAINTVDGKLFYGSGSGNIVKEFTGTITSASYAATASNITGGSTNYIPLWNSNTTLGSSSLYQAAPNQIILGNTASVHPGNEEAFAVYQGVSTSYNLISGHSIVNNYSQLNIKNFSSESGASTDIVATADNGDESINFIDMGINGSGYTNIGAVGAANDAYIYSTGADLLIGNASSDRKLILFNGGTDVAAYAKMYVHEQAVGGVIGINTDTTGDAANPAALRILPPNTSTYNLIETEANLDGFVQSTFTNLNSGLSASSDVVAYNDVDPINKTDGFIDMGITSTGYNDPINFPGWTANTSYVYTTAPKMLVGTVNNTGSIDFFVGGTNPQTNRKLKLSYTNQHELSGSLNVSGSGRFTNGLTVTSSLIAPSITGSLLGTASYATQALSASYALNTPPTFIDNIVTVGLPGSDTNYNSIKSAVDSITDSSVNNTYTVRVYPGVYIEDTITMKSFISVKGDSSISTVVSASNPSQSIFVMADQSMVIDMQIQGSTAPNVSAIYYSSPTTPQTNAIAYAENIRFGTNYTNATCAGSGSGNCILQCSNVKYGGFTEGSKSFDIGFRVTGSGGSIGRMQLRNVTSTNGGVAGTDDNQIFALADAPGCTFIVNGCLLTRATGTARGTGFKVYNGGQLRLTAVNFQRWINGIWAPQTGSAPSIDAIALNFENCTNDVLIQHTGSLGKVQGTDTFLKTTIPYEAPLYEVNTDQRKIVVAKKGGDFTSISASVAYITDSSAANRYVIEVGPGEFTEKSIDLRGKPYISIIGSDIQSTKIIPSGSGNFDQIILGPTNEVSFLSLTGNNTPGYAAFAAGDLDGFALIHKISIYDWDYGVKVVSNTSSSQFFGEYVDINGPFSYGTFVSSSAGVFANASMENYYLFPSGGVSTGNYAVGTGAELSMYTAVFTGNSVSGSIATEIANGATMDVSGLDIRNWEYGIKVPNTGTAPSFRIVGGMIHDNITNDFLIQKTGTVGRFQGISSHEKISNVSEDFYWNFLDDIDGENDVTRKLSVTFADGTHTDATTLIFNGSTMGVMSGGDITTVSGLTISTSAGFGYCEKATSPEVYQRIDWADSQITLPANSESYIYINETGLTSSLTNPSNVENIIVGRVVTNATGVEFIDQSPYDAAHTSNKLSKFNRDALGPVYAQGSTVTENVTPFKLDVTAGSYFFSENNFQPSGTSSINLNRYYTSGSGWNVSTSSIVPNNVYASGSQLTPMSSSYFTKHTVYLVGQGVDEKYFLLINNNQYSSLVDTEAASLPAAPTYFNDGVVPIAAVYVQSGSANITQIQDVRPIIGFRTAGVNASSVHGNLSGLAADDHTQYLLVSGTRQMSGDLGLGGNVLYNFSNVSGSKVQTTQLTASVASITSITGSFTGSLVGALTGTASWANSAVNANIANTASSVSTVRNTNSAPFYLTFVDTNNSVRTPEDLFTSQFVGFNPGTQTLFSTNITGSSIFAIGGFTGSLLGTASYASNGGVTQIIAGTNVTISPTNGLGVVTINSSGGGGAAFPYTGSAIISGSLTITGSLKVGIPGGTTGFVDTSVGTLSRATATSVDWFNRLLIDSTGAATSIDYDQRQILTPGGIIAFQYDDDAQARSNVYHAQTTANNTEGESLSTTALTYAGQAIAASISSTTPGEIVYLDTDGTWKTVNQTTVTSTKMLGINIDNSNVLIEGDIVLEGGTMIKTPLYGAPLYIWEAGTVTSSDIPTSGYVRTLGHCYYQNTTTTTNWIIKFRPSNDWYYV